MASRQVELLEYSRRATPGEEYVDVPGNPRSPNDVAKWLKSATTYGGESIVNEVRTEHEAIENEIEASAFILGIGNELDEDDFVAYSHANWRRATGFLRRLAIHAHSCGYAGIGVPDIVPAARGSIDLLWRRTDRRLLINFPSDEIEPASYYGSKRGSEISGRFEPREARPELILWLASQ